MDQITLDAYAKINLFLEVCEKRPDSYHNIDSVMQTVSLHDSVTLSKFPTIKLTNTASLPNDERNIAYRAAKAFFDHLHICAGALIHIEKNIPIAAGLAGGSTDAAAVLRGLNELYGADLSIDTLCEIGAKLGADVPFCVRRGTYVTKGIGDIFTPCPPMPDCFIVVSKAGEGVSTPFAYSEIDKSREDNAYVLRKSDPMITALKYGDLYQITKEMYNAFEGVVCPVRPKVNEQKEIMTQCGAVGTMMSGSGPSVFGVFSAKEKATDALFKLISYGANARLCKAI